MLSLLSTVLERVRRPASIAVVTVGEGLESHLLREGRVKPTICCRHNASPPKITISQLFRSCQLLSKEPVFSCRFCLTELGENLNYLDVVVIGPFYN